MTEKGIILDLFSESGNWSKPYREAGYEVIQVDLKHGKQDVRLIKYDPLRKVHGIIANPPCVVMSKARRRPTPDELLESLSCFDATCRLIALHSPVFWVIENPFHSRIRQFYGPPKQRIVMSRFGFPSSKETGLWGHFNKVKYPSEFTPHPAALEKTRSMKRSRKFDNMSSRQRAETPLLLGEMFFQANP